MTQKRKFTFGIRSLMTLVMAVAVACASYPVLFPPLPTLGDFAPQDTLDGKHAWGMFGGRSIADAQIVFDSNPHHHIEDFGLMGDRAFAFYFPVVESYVMRPSEFSDYDTAHNRSDYIASNIAYHFRGKLAPEIIRIAPRANNLATFVLDRIDEIQCDDRERDCVVSAWTSLKHLSDPTTLQKH